MTSIGAEYRWNPAFELGRWRTHVGAGVLIYLPHAETTINSIPEHSNYQYAGSGGQIFGGTALRVHRHIALMMEGKFDMGSLDVNLDPGTRLSTQVRTLHIIGGVSLQF
jgi:transposase